MAAHVLAAFAVVSLALGCGKTLNAAYCADHPEDVDCRNAGLVALDAPPGCSANGCTADPMATVCDMTSQQCVQCIVGGDTSACGGETPQCGDDNLCHGCIYDAHCTLSGVCLPNGQCATEESVLYARPDGAGACTKADPCSFSKAVSLVDATKNVIKLTATNGTVYREPPIVFATTQPVQVIGASTTLQPNANGDAISVTAGNVDIVGLAITMATGAGSDGVSCIGNARINLRRTTITNHAGYGLLSNGCNVTVERSRFSGNNAGAMTLSAGTLEIRNNIIDGNGNNMVTEGNVRIRNAGGRVVFNTIVANESENGGGTRVSGIDCTQAGTGVLVARNIIAGNLGANAATGGDCTLTGNYVSGSLAGIGFVSASDFHLTNTTPVVNPVIRDDPEATADCKLDGKLLDDFDGQLRPVGGFCDRGADEYRP